ncbi:hypothetical protein G7067_04895 [Leucobacter insecticola]|uniref:Uncharacterized protein n=1 Tax=Leucobacter insecticola TaxID=2714934 RepID=A0A6G8FHD0_9MICO|nr:hypothetical protein [Leucobacter insecticola]QIM15906.1 hypothetical protein G7067_04895 [Leucobacter insecticola]
MALAATATLVGGGSLLAVAAPAMAGTSVTGLSVTVTSDGTEPFDADDAPGHDSGANNGIVRAQDTVKWSVVGAEAAGTAVYTMTLPAGMVFDASSAAGTSCNGPTGGSINAAGNVLKCDRVMGGGTASLNVSARVGAVANGTDIALKVDVDGLSETSAPVKVSATPKTEIAVYGDTPTMGVDFNGVLGVKLPQGVHLGVTKDPANPSFFGYEALQTPFTFTVDVPTGAVPYSQSVGAGGGTITASQPGGAGTSITYTVTGANTSLLNATTLSGMPATMAGNNRYSINVFVPYVAGNINPGETVQLPMHVKDFDPNSLSGQSNFGTEYAPGQEPGAACQSPAVGSQLNCNRWAVTRSAGEALGATSNAAWASLSTFMFGDYYGMVEPQGRLNKAAVPGQAFLAAAGITNGGSAESSASNASGSMTWDPALLQLTGAPHLRIANTSGGAAFYNPGTGTEVDQADYTLEYTNYVFADDADRRARESFSDPSITWVTDPSELAGGIASVTSVRVKYLKPLAPNTTIGLVTPLQRTLSSAGLPTGTRLPWFWQYGSTGTPTVKSNYSGTGLSGAGGNIQASDALVRADVAWQKVEGETYAAGNAQRGDIVNLKITPVVIGPVGNANTVAAGTKVTVTMPNACLEPVADVLPSNAQLTPVFRVRTVPRAPPPRSCTPSVT